MNATDRVHLKTMQARCKNVGSVLLCGSIRTNRKYYSWVWKRARYQRRRSMVTLTAKCDRQVCGTLARDHFAFLEDLLPFHPSQCPRWSRVRRSDVENGHFWDVRPVIPGAVVLYLAR